MLKFQDDYTTIIATFEDFILLVYTIIDDLYHQCGCSKLVSKILIFLVKSFL